MKIQFGFKKILLVGLLFLISCDNDDSVPTSNDDQENQLQNYESTYAVIQGEIFDKYCISCHNLENPSGNLVLTSDSSYIHLVDEIPYHYGTHGPEFEYMRRVSSMSADPSSEHEGLYNSFL